MFSTIIGQTLMNKQRTIKKTSISIIEFKKYAIFIQNEIQMGKPSEKELCKFTAGERSSTVDTSNLCRVI